MKIALSNKYVLANHPVTIYRRLVKLLPVDFIGWEIVTFLRSIIGVTDDLAIDKLLAVKALAQNSMEVMSLAIAFENVCNSFCNNPVIHNTLQPLEVEELTYSVYQILDIVKLVHPDVPPAALKFTGEIPGYCASCAKYERWQILPGVLSFAQGRLYFLNNSAHKKLYNEIHTIMLELETRGPFSLKEIAGLRKTIPNTTSYNIVKRLVGCRVYDPTIIE